MRLRGHYQLAAPKAGSTFDGAVLESDVKIGPLAELMLVEKTFERIDPRLPAHIVKTRGHLMEDGQKTLYCVRRLLWDQVENMITELDNSGDGQVNYVDTRSKWPGKQKKNSKSYPSRRREVAKAHPRGVSDSTKPVMRKSAVVASGPENRRRFS